MNSDHARSSAPAAEAVTTFMGRALELATHAIGISEPNPRVGCVITSPDGRVIGQGHTQEAGGAHAEVMALREAAARGEPCAGATVYVTLEPCAHFGRTPPCSDALVAAKVGCVVVALTDPNPKVAGRGIALLRQQGIHVVELPFGPMPVRALELNIGFFSRMQRGRPWVRTQASAMECQAWRGRAGAVLFDRISALACPPSHAVRQSRAPLPPLRVILDPSLRSASAAVLLNPSGPVLVYCTRPHTGRRSALEALGATIAQLPTAGGRTDLHALMKDLGQRGVNELLVVADRSLHCALERDGLVDETRYRVGPPTFPAAFDAAEVEAPAGVEDGVPRAYGRLLRLGADIDIVRHGPQVCLREAKP